jgi:hypothetical protein
MGSIRISREQARQESPVTSVEKERRKYGKEKRRSRKQKKGKTTKDKI